MSDPITPDLVEIVPPVPNYVYKQQDDPVSVAPGAAASVEFTADAAVDVSLATLSAGVPLEATLEVTPSGGNALPIVVLFTTSDNLNACYPLKYRLASGDKVSFAVVNRGEAAANVYMTVETKPVA